jgi:hypothetical protein
MDRKPIVAAITAAWLGSLGCSEPMPPQSDAIERANSRELTLTSTAVTLFPEPVEEQREAFEPELVSTEGLTIKRFVTAAEIENREPIAISSVFGDHDEKVYAFVEVSNESEEEKVLLVDFVMPEGQRSRRTELRVPPVVGRWRTWAYARHPSKPGQWRVEIRSADGGLLGALPFQVEPGC